MVLISVSTICVVVVGAACEVVETSVFVVEDIKVEVVIIGEVVTILVVVRITGLTVELVVAIVLLDFNDVLETMEVEVGSASEDWLVVVT